MTFKVGGHRIGLVPALCLVTTLVLIPVFIMLWASLKPNNLVNFEGMGPGNYFYLGSRSYYLSVGLATLRIALACAAISVVTGYLTAFALTKIGSAKANILLIVVTLPILSGPLVVVLGWMLLLADSGPINSVVQWAGFPAIRFLGSETGVVIGITQFLLPFTIVTLYGAISAVPQTLVEAARSLGASRLKIFLRVVGPLTIPGIYAAFAVSFALAISSYVSPHYLGGAAQPTLVTVSTDFILTSYNPELAATASIALLCIMALTLMVSGRLAAGMVRT